MAFSGHLPHRPPPRRSASRGKAPGLTRAPPALSVRPRPFPRRQIPRKMAAVVRSDAGASTYPPPSSSSSSPSGDSEVLTVLPEQPGGKVVAELVGAFNELTERMGSTALSTCSTRLLFRCLKLSIPLLRALPPGPDGRPPLARALAVARTLADFQMDAEIISAGILRVVLESGAASLLDVKRHVGVGTAHLLHECLRIRKLRSKVEELDDESASALRKFYLSYYDIRAIVLELALRLDRMRHLSYLSRYHQQSLALEVMKIYAPLAHAVGASAVSLELEDLSFQYLFPHSYLYIDAWLRSHEIGRTSLDMYREQLLESLMRDDELSSLVDDITVKGRYKSRFSTMKKVLKDGRRPEDVHDVLGLRVILNPRHGEDMEERGRRACYRAHEVIKSLWKEIPSRVKDYVARPKANGYRSLHVAVDVSDDVEPRPLMEIQIRTTEMDALAAGGDASHALYKGGLTDPSEAKRLKAIMIAAAELAAIRLSDPASSNHRVGAEIDQRDRMFRLLDKNGDGKISIEELTEVMEELGAEGDNAQEFMQLLDANSDGSLSSDEFDSFQRQVKGLHSLEDEDDHYRTMLREKLQTTDTTSLIRVYQKEFGDKLAVM